MASNFLIGFLTGLGFAAWIYSKMMKSTGGNVKNSLIVAGFSGLGAMAVVSIFLGIVFK